MKYSLLFLIFVLLWSALLINGWMNYRNGATLAAKLEDKNTQLDSLIIREDQLAAVEKLKDVRAKLRPQKQFLDRIVEAIDAEKISAIDLAAISEVRAVVAGMPRVQATDMMERADKFAIRIPDDRKIEIRAEFYHTSQPSESETRRFLLSPGKHAFKIVRSQNRRYPAVNVTIHLKGLEPIVWDHKLDFNPNHRSGGQSLTRAQSIDDEPLILVSASHKGPTRSGKQIDVSVSLVDVTNNE